MKNISEFLSEHFQFLVVRFSIYLNRRVFVMRVTDYMSLSVVFLVVRFSIYLIRRVFLMRAILYMPSKVVSFRDNKMDVLKGRNARVFRL